MRRSIWLLTMAVLTTAAAWARKPPPEDDLSHRPRAEYPEPVRRVGDDREWLYLQLGLTPEQRRRWKEMDVRFARKRDVTATQLQSLDRQLYDARAALLTPRQREALRDLSAPKRKHTGPKAAPIRRATLPASAQ